MLCLPARWQQSSISWLSVPLVVKQIYHTRQNPPNISNLTPQKKVFFLSIRAPVNSSPLLLDHEMFIDFDGLFIMSQSGSHCLASLHEPQAFQFLFHCTQKLSRKGKSSFCRRKSIPLDESGWITLLRVFRSGNKTPLYAQTFLRRFLLSMTSKKTKRTEKTASSI